MSSVQGRTAQLTMVGRASIKARPTAQAQHTHHADTSLSQPQQNHGSGNGSGSESSLQVIPAQHKKSWALVFSNNAWIGAWNQLVQGKRSLFVIVLIGFVVGVLVGHIVLMMGWVNRGQSPTHTYKQEDITINNLNMKPNAGEMRDSAAYQQQNHQYASDRTAHDLPLPLPLHSDTNIDVPSSIQNQTQRNRNEQDQQPDEPKQLTAPAALVDNTKPESRAGLLSAAQGMAPFNASITLLFDHMKVLERGADPELYHEMKRPIEQPLLSQFAVMNEPHPMKLDELCFNDKHQLMMKREAQYAGSSMTKVLHGAGTLLYVGASDMDEPRAHFVFLISNLINVVRQARTRADLYPRPTILMLNSLKIADSKYHKATPLWERKLLGYIASQVDEVVTLDELRIAPNTQQCFANGYVVRKKAWHLFRPQDFQWLRQSVSQFAKTPLKNHCSEVGRRNQKPVVWVLNRRVYSRKLLHIEQVRETIQDVFREGGLDVEVVEFESPNAACDGRCSGRIQCFRDAPFVNEQEDYPFYTQYFARDDLPALSSYGGKCYDRDIDFDIAAFNNISFLVAIHGGGLMNAMFLPDQAVMIEVHPYGVGDTSYSDFYNRSALNHVHYYEESDDVITEKFGRKMSAEELWRNENKGLVKSLPVKITLDKFRPVLVRAREIWKRDCFRQ